MPKSEKRGKGKRHLGEASHEPPSHGFAPINYPPESTSEYGERFKQPQATNISSYTSRPHISGNVLIPPHGKIAIPSLKPRQSAEGSTKSKKGRTAHACDTCRRSKAGCSGEQPCSRCRNSNVECVYGDGKRDRDRKQLAKLSKDTNVLNRANSELVEAFRRIRNNTALSSDEMREEIDEVLSMASAGMTPDTGQHSQTREGTSEQQAENSDDDNSEVGSTESIDVINVDTDRDDTRPTGHMGKSSSVAWAKRTAEAYLQGRHQDDSPAAQPRDEMGYALASYHTEDADLEDVDTSNVDPYEWPNAHVAESLLHEYFNHVHSALPLINKHTFLAKFMSFEKGSRNLSSEDAIFLANLNTMFAISSVYLQLTGSDREHYADHYIYLARAKMLCLDRGLLYQDARISTTCALGLMCLYFLCVCKLNRAWTLGGLAIRQAFTLGLHNRNASRELPDIEKEYRVRLWWSLFSLECLLNELTGRPSGISDRDISTPLPLNVDEDNLYQHESLYADMQDRPSNISSRRNSHGSRGPSSTFRCGSPQSYTFPPLPSPPTTSTYFIYRTQLSLLSHEIVTQLYSASAIRDKWTEVQHTIQVIDSRLLAWKDSLPPSFSIDMFPSTNQDWSDPHNLERIGLAMLWHSSRMILFRPCLCRFSNRNGSASLSPTKQHTRSQDYNLEAVTYCLASARAMISLLALTISFPTSAASSSQQFTSVNPSSPSAAAKISQIPPFHTPLHQLAESLSILLLELAFQAAHVSTAEAEGILEDVIKGVGWLAEMSAVSVSARKAWEIFDRLVRLVAGGDGHSAWKWKLEELPHQAGVPGGYNWRRFVSEEDGGQQHSLQHHQPHQLPPPASGHREWGQHAQAQYYGHEQEHEHEPSNPFVTGTGGGFAPTSGGGMGHSLNNPLDHDDAVQKFQQMGMRYGRWDEPWEHMFVPSSAGAPADEGMNVAMGGMEGSGMGQGGYEALGGGIGGGMNGVGVGGHEGYRMMGYAPGSGSGSGGHTGSGGELRYGHGQPGQGSYERHQSGRGYEES